MKKNIVDTAHRYSVPQINTTIYDTKKRNSGISILRSKSGVNEKVILSVLKSFYKIFKFHIFWQLAKKLNTAFHHNLYIKLPNLDSQAQESYANAYTLSSKNDVEPELRKFLRSNKILEHRLVIDDSHVELIDDQDDKELSSHINFKKLHETYQKFLNLS